MRQRAAIVQIIESADDVQARVIVTLNYDDATYEGVAIGHPGASARPRLAAEATLRAVERVIGNTLLFEVAAIATTEVGDAQVAMAQIKIIGTGERFVGSTLITASDDTGAAVKAVLDALNRKLSTIIGAG